MPENLRCFRWFRVRAVALDQAFHATRGAWAAILAVSWLVAPTGSEARAATTVKLGQVRQISTLADVDLDGEFVYAINFSADDPIRVVRGVTFLPDNRSIPGAALSGPQQVTPWQSRPELGASGDSNQFEEILQDIRWANTGAGERLRATLTVKAGDEYKLQVFISANGNENRRWDIRVNGREAVDEITSLGVSPGHSYSPNRATMYTYQFTATNTPVVVEMGHLFGSNDGGDRNPIWQALTLERVTVPPTPDEVLASESRFFARQTVPVARFTAVDRRSGATHRFALVDGAGSADNGKFRFGGADLVPAEFDFSMVPAGLSFSIRVRAIDEADANRFLEKVFLLTLVEPSAPTALRLDASSLESGVRAPALVARVRVIDPDEFDQHLIQLVAGAGDRDNGSFVVAGDALRLVRDGFGAPGEARIRLRATDLTGLTKEESFVLPRVPIAVRFNEVLASEVSGVGSVSGLPEEWIELFNPGSHYLDLSGWHLTDDRENLGTWTFPASVLPPGGYLLVLADGSPAPPAGSTNLHANFSLDAGGEWIGLARPDAATLVTNLAFPPQYPGVAFGVGANGGLGHLPRPTPGAENGTVAEGGENVVTFSKTRGFQTNSFELSLVATIPGSVIRYSLDGTVPTATTGMVYSGPFAVSPNTSSTVRGTRIVRALATHPTAAFSRVLTHTYLFVNGVSGPLVDGLVGQSRLVSSIRNHAVYGPLLDDAFLALPALAVTMTAAGPTTTERVASLELFDPEGREDGFQINCGIAVTGTSSLSSPKLSMAARFRTEYGSSRLRYPIFDRGSMVGGRAAREFNELRLRSHSHDTFYWLGTRENPPVPYGSPSVNRSGDAQLARNPWIDEMQIAMGQPGKRGRQVHLYLNGSYHGIYHIHEHPDEDFMASYYGGDRTDYHFTGGGTGGSQHANGESWSRIWAGVKASTSTYAQARRWIDVTNLCDYMVLSFYAGNDWDWSALHNWGAAGPRLADRGGWKFFQQDSDITLQDIAADCTDQAVPDGIFTSLMRFPDFKVLFRDRIAKHMTGSGMLTPARAAAFYNARMNEISTAIVAETARWQPSSSVATLPWDRDQEWANEWRYLRDIFFPQRTARMFAQFKSRGWWTIEPPSPTVAEGRVAEGQTLGFGAGAGAVYYTTDGSDPRLPGGSINPTARTGAAPVVAGPTVIRARRYVGTDWSALTDLFYLPEGIPAASSSNLVITEIQYHPMDESNAEFLEFMNTSTASVDLSGVAITNGVSFVFPRATVLGAGERVVVVRDLAAFDARYATAGGAYFRPGVRRLGPWSGALSNDGEVLDVIGADGSLMFACAYRDDGPWPGRAGGRGSSLELETPPEQVPIGMASRTAWLAEPRHWRPSSEFHGSPGSAGAGSDQRVVINELLATSVENQTDAIEFLNLTETVLEVSGWFVSDNPANYRKYRLPSAFFLAPGARLVLRESDFNAPGNPLCLEPFVLDAKGDDVYLVQADANGALLRFVDHVEFGPGLPGVTLGRSPDGTGPIVWLQEASLGGVNGPGRPGYEAWAGVSFSNSTSADMRRREADPDHDGYSNFAEYAFVLAPDEADGAVLGVEVAPGRVGELDLEYRVRTLSPDLVYAVEVSSDLRSWAAATGEIEERARLPQSDGASLVKARLRTDAAGPAISARFIRIRAMAR